jgi:hypothetical protein
MLQAVNESFRVFRQARPTNLGHGLERALHFGEQVGDGRQGEAEFSEQLFHLVVFAQQALEPRALLTEISSSTLASQCILLTVRR